jgi:hypothetical protein
MRKFVNFYDKVSAVHQEMVNEIANIFKEHNETKISIMNVECPLYLQMNDEWGEDAYNRCITDIECETKDNGMVDIKLYRDSTQSFYDLGDCADGNALLYIYEYVYQHFNEKS